MNTNTVVDDDVKMNDDDLGSDNESDNESVTSDNPAADNYEACKAAVKLGRASISPDNLGIIEEGILKLKSIIHNELFQNGSSENVHDTERLNDYVNVNGNIYRHVTNNEELEDYGSTINDAIKEFLELWSSNQGTTDLDREMQKNFLHLHLICFCYCHNSDCLSMDYESDNNS